MYSLSFDSDTRTSSRWVLLARIEDMEHLHLCAGLAVSAMAGAEESAAKKLDLTKEVSLPHVTLLQSNGRG